MTKEIEKLLMWLVPLIVLSTIAEAVIGKLSADVISSAQSADGSIINPDPFILFGSTITTGMQLYYLSLLKSFPLVLERAAIGIWLFLQTRRQGYKPSIWLLSGLCIKYWALALFLFSYIIKRETTASRVPGVVS